MGIFPIFSIPFPLARQYYTFTSNFLNKPILNRSTLLYKGNNYQLRIAVLMQNSATYFIIGFLLSVLLEEHFFDDIQVNMHFLVKNGLEIMN